MTAQLFKARTGQRGFTLIELLLYVAIVGALLTSVITFFGVAADARVKDETIAEVNDQGTAAIDYIAQTIRNASSITSPIAGSNAASLTLNTAAGSTLINLSGVVLQTREGVAGQTIPLTNTDMQITNLNFANLTRSGTQGMIKFTFKVAHTNPASRNEYDYQQTFASSAEVEW
ncbi:MAG TPA: prepilin-type N-terminal cleavage/methylation domain-containing protein [Candidatus Saccharimonadales bacterium]|nr:prepilin-type N-terminal cleavage/methylation domain-containing protein [Candidatus Saccharimonadales bacterium]